MPNAASAIVVPLCPPAVRQTLTIADRIEALQWEATKAVEAGARLVFHRSIDPDPAESGDYISIYHGDDRWAAWSAARRGRSINVWRCATGADLGYFPTMHEALAALKGFLRRQA